MGLLADSGTRIRPDSGNHRPLGESVPIYQKNFNKKLRMIGPLGILPARSLANFLTKYTGEVKTVTQLPNIACFITPRMLGSPAARIPLFSPIGGDDGG